MRRPIAFNDLHPEYRDILNRQLTGIKEITQLCADRSIDDYDELLGLLAAIISKTYGYSKEEIICCINEQFDLL